MSPLLEAYHAERSNIATGIAGMMYVSSLNIFEQYMEENVSIFRKLQERLIPQEIFPHIYRDSSR
jgi:hypothetical protein